MIDSLEKLNTALGFAMKAGKLAVGEFAAQKAAKSGNAKLIILDPTASDNTKKQWRDACAFRDLPLVTAKDMGEAIGKPGRMVAAATDENFSKMIIKAAENCEQNAHKLGGND